MTYILVTNDDGVKAPGIQALAQAMQPLGEVEVVAPAENQSATGHKKTLFQDIVVQQTSVAGDIPALAVGGSPADCIALAAMGMSKWPPRLVVSGINRGANMAQDVTQSGTVAAGLEATLHAVPAIAFSLDNHDAADIEDYALAARIATQIVRYILDKPLPQFTILNVNIPNASEVKGLRLTRQGIRIYRDKIEQHDGFVRIVGPPPTGKIDEAGTDLWAVHNGYASITPIHLDMTAHQFMADVAAWDIELD